MEPHAPSKIENFRADIAEFLQFRQGPVNNKGDRESRNGHVRNMT